MRILLLAGAAACAATDTSETAAPIVTTHNIYVYANGAIAPRTTTIDPGDQVRFILQDVRDSVIPADGPGTYPAICDTARPWFETDPNGFAGPMPHQMSGIFTLSPNAGEPSLVAMTSPSNPCGGAEVRGHVGDHWLCASGPVGASLDETWDDPHTMGAYLRLNWSDLNPADGVYTLDGLVAEVERAVAHGKLFSLSIEAGSEGTPDWIFDTSVVYVPVGFPPVLTRVLVPRANGGGGVPRVVLRDSASSGGPACGTQMDLGDPGRAEYQAHYISMLAAVASRLKSNAAWYRALAYVKVSGANLFTAESRLPKRCDPGCDCNPQIWSDAGYRPSGLQAFFGAVEANLAYWFPGKTMSYQLIQDGFPRIDEAGGYLDVNGAYVDRNGMAPPNAIDIGPHEQTDDAIAHGQTTWGDSFAVQHNGLQPTLLPNQWVIDAGANGPTGFQTQNIQQIDDNALLESALGNALANSSATFVEIYEERGWEARLEGTLDPANPASRSLGWWANQFHARRLGVLPQNVPLVPIAFLHTPQRYPLGPAGDQTLYFIHGAKCASNSAGWGKIVIRP